MALRPCQIRANNKYAAKTYDRIGVFFKKGGKAKLQAHVKNYGYSSVNSFVNRAIAEQMRRDLENAEKSAKIETYGGMDMEMFTTEHGNTYAWEAIVALMDDELCEEVHRELVPCTNEDFFNRYCELHLAKYGEEFEFAKPNPVV